MRRISRRIVRCMGSRWFSLCLVWGMSLCRLHHAAFDRLMLGVHPSYVIHVRRDILEEVDGPILRHGLQGLEGDNPIYYNVTYGFKKGAIGTLVFTKPAKSYYSGRFD